MKPVPWASPRKRQMSHILPPPKYLIAQARRISDGMERSVAFDSVCHSIDSASRMRGWSFLSSFRRDSNVIRKALRNPTDPSWWYTFSIVVRTRLIGGDCFRFLGGFFFRTVIHTKAISSSFKPSIRDEDADCCLDRLSLESPETEDTRDKPDADDKSDWLCCVIWW